jgi:hypothetical protein
LLLGVLLTTFIIMEEVGNLDHILDLMATYALSFRWMAGCFAPF